MHRWLLWTPDLSQWSTQGHGDNWDTHPNTQLTTGNWWRNISSQLQRIGCHWGLLWRQEGSYWSTAWSRMPLVTTVIPIWIGSWLLKTNEGSTVVNWRKINVTGDYCILIQIYSWLLWSQGGFRVVYCRDLNIIGVLWIQIYHSEHNCALLVTSNWGLTHRGYICSRVIWTSQRVFGFKNPLDLGLAVKFSILAHLESISKAFQHLKVLFEWGHC